MNDMDSRTCAICGKPYEEPSEASVFGEAGQWLSEELWNEDGGTLCAECLENRARLAMMYIVDR